MRVAVTGASGFVGRALCPMLVARGHQLAAIDRAATGDLAGFPDWPRLLAGADAVVHLAALAHAGGASRERIHAVNVEVPAALGKAAAEAGVRLVFLSSAKVLGEETRGSAFGEASPLAPRDSYGRAKAEAESALRAIARLQLTVLRPPLAYGPGVKANFLALMRAVARGWPFPFASIANRRSLAYVGNLADAIVRCVESPQAAGRSYLVAGGSPVSTPELCRALGDALGRPARLFPFPPALLELASPLKRLTRSLELNDSAIRSELNWTPPFAFDQAIRLTAEWFRAHGR